MLVLPCVILSWLCIAAARSTLKCCSTHCQQHDMDSRTRVQHAVQRVIVNQLHSMGMPDA